MLGLARPFADPLDAKCSKPAFEGHFLGDAKSGGAIARRRTGIENTPRFETLQFVNESTGWRGGARRPVFSAQMVA